MGLFKLIFGSTVTKGNYTSEASAEKAAKKAVKDSKAAELVESKLSDYTIVEVKKKLTNKKQ